MPVVIAIIIALITIANAWHVLSQAIANRPGNLFTGIAHYFADYFLYISQIAQGQSSSSLFSNHLYTNEPLAPTWIYWFNALLGKIHLNPFLVYNAALILLVIFTLILLWYVIKRAITDTTTRYIAFIFAVSASNFFDFKNYVAHGTYTMLGDFWFSPTPALNRLGGVPHQIMQTMLCLSVITLYIKLRSTKTKAAWQYALLFALTVLATIANPIQMLLVAITIGILFAWRIYAKTLTSSDGLVALFILLPALLAAYATNLEFSHQPILSAAKAWENNQQFHLSIPQFIWALGPIAIFLPFGIYIGIKKQTPLFITLILYTLCSLIFFFSPLPTLLGTSPVRWLSPAGFIGLALVCANGFVWCARFIGKKTKQPTLSLMVGLTLYLVLTLPSLVAQIQARTLPLQSDPKLIALNHLSNDVVDALVAIQNTPADGVVLTDPALAYDVLVPVMTGKKSFTGHPIHTLYPEVKEGLRQKFFAGTMNQTEALKFMTDHTIVYIITTPDRAPLLHTYPFLKELFTNSVLTIYQR